MDKLFSQFRGNAADDPLLEPERYELRSDDLPYTFDLNRRDFCRALGGGLIVLLVLPAIKAVAQEREQSGRRGRPGPTPDLGAWIRIDPDGKVHAHTGKVEVGQGTRTMLTGVIADELHVPLEQVILTMGDTAISPFDRGTFGSRSTPDMAPQLRRAAAAAREALKEIAASRWQTTAAELDVRDGKVLTKNGDKSASFAELTKDQALTRTIQADESITAADQWTVTGKPANNVNSIALVTGTHKYPSDMRAEGMLYGRVLRPPTQNHQLASADTSAAEKLPGVIVVRDNNFVGVAAPTALQAERAIAAIKPTWTAPASPAPAEKELFDFFKSHPSEPRGGWGGSESDAAGNTTATLQTAAKRFETQYTVPYIAHVPLETRAALAEWKDGKVTIWTGTQRPFGVRTDVAQAFSMPEESVHVLMPDTGSGYGGKHTAEVAIEAARLAKAAQKPVKVTWTREEEFRYAYLRPAGLIEIRAGVDADGKLIAWEHHNWNSGASGIKCPYAVENQVTQFHSTNTPFKQGSYRGLAATANNFAREVHIDSLASEAKLDPLEFRRKNLNDERLLAVLNAVAKEIGWEQRKKQANRGFGIAIGAEKGGYVATAVEIEASGDQNPHATILRAVTAFECGAIINPNTLQNQVEGALIQGLGGALFEAIHFESGQVTNAFLSQYPVPRFRDVPPIKSILIDRKDLPSAGAGETPLIAIAPAITNAIADATGKRLRSLPLHGAG